MTIRNLYESLVIAFSTYSSIPMPRVDWNDENMKYTICFFPLIGAEIGAISWLFAALAAAFRIGVILRSAVLVLIPL
ncbi:MAG: adenosylcobinamide-GDP ribazoletransferase, partial [Porcincola intestinalis]|uniref:adenosylcobinamide-GDP ribazoletransferase n=1 Tax=Porcincola intestinalis TaxID=2606632 RepID=UPI002A90EB37